MAGHHHLAREVRYPLYVWTIFYFNIFDRNKNHYFISFAPKALIIKINKNCLTLLNGFLFNFSESNIKKL